MKTSIKATPLTVADWDPSLSHIIDDMNGQPLNVHSLMANHPELLKAWWNYRNYSVAGGDLGKRRGELVILRVAIHMKSWYEWSSHVERALSCGLTLEEIERVKQGTQAPEWSSGEALLLKAVDELIANHAIAAETLEDLYEHYTTRQVMDIIAIQGMYITLGSMINTWGLELDDHVQKKLPESVTKVKFEEGFPRS
ncbi:MAG: carboxymuconolactone decarboxylase family protein [Deltaproteobacteria bacterium]|nr:MAG: carboxymuconolactone decarboxylase family protein [Deltaproteobacteria bacterium]